MKRINTPCPEHADCVIRITTGGGQDVVEHSSVVERLEQAAEELSRVRSRDSVQAVLTGFERGITELQGARTRLESATDDLHDRLSKMEGVVQRGIGHELEAAKAAQVEFRRVTEGLEQRFASLVDTVDATVKRLERDADALAKEVNDARVVAQRAESNSSQLSLRMEDFEAKATSELKQVAARIPNVDLDHIIGEVYARVTERMLRQIGA